MNGHYGVFCDICHDAVEYADITKHEHIRIQAQEARAAQQTTTKTRRFDAFWHHKDRDLNERN